MDEKTLKKTMKKIAEMGTLELQNYYEKVANSLLENYQKFKLLDFITTRQSLLSASACVICSEIDTDDLEWDS